MTAGEIFYCLPALDGQPCPVDAIAAIDSVVVRIPTSTFHQNRARGPRPLAVAEWRACTRAIGRAHQHMRNRPLFGAIPAKERRVLEASSEVERFRRGARIFEEGSPAHNVWMLRRGWASLTKRSPEGQEVIVCTLAPEERLCGVPVLEQGVYPISAISGSDTELIRIPMVVFRGLVERCPALATHVVSTCGHVLDHMAEMCSVAYAPAEQRVAYALLHLQANLGNTLGITHQELARLAHTRVETSIRIIAGLKRRGWLSTSRGRMAILRARQLRTLLTRHVRPSAPQCSETPVHRLPLELRKHYGQDDLDVCEAP